jgi:excisionase family DNA binding protein
MTVSRIPQVGVDAVEEWLTVHDACALIGVSPATLRRWSAAGDVQAFTTPGGHRRFARSTIMGLLPSARKQRPTLERLGETPEHMTRVVRRNLGQACQGVTWIVGLGEDELEPLRDHGRRIAGSLLGFIDGGTPDERRAAIADAMCSATEYGRIAARGRGEIRETVEAFLRFRMLFLGELAQMAGRRGLDTAETSDLLVTATEAIDLLLVALMNGHENERAQLASPKEVT